MPYFSIIFPITISICYANKISNPANNCTTNAQSKCAKCIFFELLMLFPINSLFISLMHIHLFHFFLYMGKGDDKQVTEYDSYPCAFANSVQIRNKTVYIYRIIGLKIYIVLFIYSYISLIIDGFSFFITAMMASRHYTVFICLKPNSG